MNNPQAEPRIQEIVSRLIAEALTTPNKGFAHWEPGEAVYLQENMLTIPVNIKGDGETFISAFASMSITRDEHGTRYTMTTFINDSYNFQHILSWNVLDDGDRVIEDEAGEKQIDIIVTPDLMPTTYIGFSTLAPVPYMIVNEAVFHPRWDMKKRAWVYSVNNPPQSKTGYIYG